MKEPRQRSTRGNAYYLGAVEVARWHARIRTICEMRAQAERRRIYLPEPRPAERRVAM